MNVQGAGESATQSAATQPAAAPALRLTDLTQDTVVFPWQQRTPLHALRVLPAIALSLWLGRRLGHPAAGSIAAGAAYTIGFAVFHEALASTLLSMLLVTLGIGSATLLGSLAAPWAVTVLLVTAMAAFNYGLLSGLGPTASWIGQNCGVYAVVTSFFARGPHYAVGRTGMVLAGGALQMTFHTLFHLMGKRGSPHVPVWRQMRTRSRELVRGFAAELTWNASTSAYTARLTVALLLATLLYRHDQLHNGYWAPMTALLVLKPQWVNTMSRGLARTVGTVAGAGAAALLTHLHHGALAPATYFALILLAAWTSLAVQAVNYAAFSATLTLYIVFLFAFGGFSQRSAAEIRLAMTVLGGAIALAVDLLWLAFVRLHPTHPAAATPAVAAGLATPSSKGSAAAATLTGQRSS